VSTTKNGKNASEPHKQAGKIKESVKLAATGTSPAPAKKFTSFS
jgi:hypothetical protein